MPKNKCTECEALNDPIAKYCSQCGFTLPKMEPISAPEPVEVEKPAAKSKLLPILIAIVVFGISYVATQQFFTSSPSLNQNLIEVANELNKNCPMMIDEQTKLVNAAALPDNVFIYNYMLTNLERDGIDIEEATKTMEPILINNIKSNPDMKYFKDNNVTLSYSYKDKHGVFVMKINVTPAMYH